MAKVKSREATMTAFLDAALESLIERGYAGTTTAEISRRAGASPGLFVRYWPTKAALLVAAAAYAQRQSLARFEELWRPEAGLKAALRTIIDLFAEPEMRCLAELEAAARTDPELATALAGSTGAIETMLHRAARRFGPERAQRKAFDQRVQLVLDCARGVAQRTAVMSPRRAQAARAEAAETLSAVFHLDP